MQAAEDDGLARALVETVASLCPGAAMYTQEGSAVWEAARRAGVRPLAEFHADRPLRGDGSIVLPTSVEPFEPSPEFVSEQVRGFLERGRVAAFDGGEVAVRAGTISVHSDGPDALALAAAVRLGAEQAGARLSADLEQLVGSRR
jgi:5-oxoprolinase (ATP-hydrolysing) subunit A